MNVLLDDENSTKLIMNKSISTPFHCAMHISELLMQRSVLARVDNGSFSNVWDMNRPLEENCELKFSHFKDTDPLQANKAFWRSCSFVLGYLMETAFKDSIKIDLCSFPPPDLNSGSFVYDAQLNIGNEGWRPSPEELRCLSISAVKLINKQLRFERLRIRRDLAEEMFKYNKFKLEQIPLIAQSDENEQNEYLTVYKLGDFVDISKGPMISNTSLIGRFQVAGIFNLDTESYGQIQRIQGVAIPVQLPLHNWTFDLLVDRASKVNSAVKPSLVQYRSNRVSQKQSL